MQILKGSSKKLLAFALTAAMSVSGLYIAAPAEVMAAGTAVDRADSSIVYFVDCGDINPATVPADGQLGTHNSVTDQVYGVDQVTGFKWGIDDTTDGSSGNGVCSVGGVSTDWTWPYEFTTADSSTRLATNRYTKNQTEKGVNPRFLDYRFELENGEYFVEVGFADPWGVSNSPSVYANYEKANKTTIKENVNVSENGGVVTGTVQVTDGELTINARSTSAAINMTYITIKSAGDAALVQTDYDALRIQTSGVTSDLELPTKGTKAGSTITWESSNEAVITRDGKVTRPVSGEEDAIVELTATITKGNTTLTKKFTVTVTALNELMGLSYFEHESVEVTDAYYDNALELDVDNLLALDPDRLLAGFRETAAYAAGMTAEQRKTYMKGKTRYGGGWENSLIGGHTLGHYMSAVAQGIVNPGLSAEDRAALTERLNYIVDALADCQAKTAGSSVCKEGYIFGATLTNPTTNLEMQFDNVEKNLANISTQAWVPWYTMHKILAGLVDAYEVAGNEKALEVAEKLGTWTANRVNSWSASTQTTVLGIDDTQTTVLGIEYGGMNDALYQLYKVSSAANKEDFKKAAHQFDEVNLFETVLAGTGNCLNGKHANTTIPKFLGALCRYEVDNNETKYLQYAEAFWDMVIQDHTYITGGNSEDEHFGADNILNAERTNANNETCNTYNMLKLSRRLFIITGDKKYADYYENTLINAIMSSQNHETGLTMYFQPMATGYQKVFGTLDTNFWCCTGSGMENFTKLQDSIYFKKEGMVVVNQYLASKVTGEGYTIEQTGDLSKSETMTFTVAGDNINFDLKLRVPDWVPNGNVTVKFGETVYDYTTRSGYITIPNDMLKAGAVFTVELPMETVAYNLPDSENTYAFKYGPFVISAKLGTASQSTGSHGVAVTVPTAKAVTSDSIGIRSEASVEDFMTNINKYMVKKEGSLDFTLTGTNFKYPFTSHYNQDTENYGIYWTYYVDEDGRGSEEVLAEKEASRIADATVDKMEQAGRGQYESRFLLPDGETKDGLIDNGSIGKDAPELSRAANANGSFGYKMLVTEGEDNYLLVTYAKADDGKPMKITVGDTTIFEGTLDFAAAEVNNLTLAEADQADYYQVMYKIPESVVAANVQSLDVLEESEVVTKRVITVMFAGTETEASARVNKSVVLLKAFRNTNALKTLSYNGKAVTAVNDTYTITTPYNVDPTVEFVIADSYGYVEIDGNAIDEREAKKLKTTGVETTFAIKVYAEDFKTVKTYTIKVVRDYKNVSTGNYLVKSFTFENTTDGAVAVIKAKDATPIVKSGAAYTYQTGVVGKAITLPGTYGLKLLDNANVLGDSYTISFWMNTKAVGSAFNPTITAGTFNPEYWLNLTLDGKIWSKNGAYIDTGASGAYIANKWQQVTVVVDGTKAGTTAGTVLGKLYVDGKLVSSGNVADGIMTQKNAKLYLGVNAWDAYMTGAADEIMLFNKALSEAEVQGIAGGKITTETIKKSVPVTAVRLNKTSAEMTAGKTLKLTATVSPANATDKKVIYTSSNTAVATVSAAGVVTAKKAGTVKITAKTANGKTAVCTVQVYSKTSKIAVKSAGYTLNGNKIYLVVKKKAALNVTVSPKTAKQGVTYKSNKTYVTVNKKGVVTAKKYNKKPATITITAKDGKTKKIQVYVVKKAKVNTTLKLKKTKVRFKKKGAEAQISVKKMTAKTTSKLTYKVVSGKKYVKVDKYGKLTCKVKPTKKAKTAKVQVTCGKKKATVTITMKK